MVRLDKQSLVDVAVASGVKPVSALLGLLSLAMQPLLGRERASQAITEAGAIIQ